MATATEYAMIGIMGSALFIGLGTIGLVLYMVIMSF